VARALTAINVLVDDPGSLTVTGSLTSHGFLSAVSASLIVTGTVSADGGLGLLGGTLMVSPGGRVSAAGTTTLTSGQSGAAIFVDSRSFVEFGTSGTAAPGGITVDPSGGAGGYGTLAAPVVNNGTIEAQGSFGGRTSTLEITDTVTGDGLLDIAGGQSEAFAGQSNLGGVLRLDSSVTSSQTVSFSAASGPGSAPALILADAAGVLELDDIAGFSGSITAHQAGDSFVITGGTLSGLSVSNANTLTASDSGSGTGAGGVDSIIFGSTINASGFNIVNSNTIAQVACFAAGTRIETEHGPVAVEDLTVGNLLMTASGAREFIIWLGQRTVHCRAQPTPETVWPVRVSAGAFGENVPVRDLYLSPDHAVFVNGVLAPVKLLINDTTIAQVKRDRVTYYHAELPEHEVILAEGLPVESYLDTGDRTNFAGGETIPAISRLRGKPRTGRGDDLGGARRGGAGDGRRGTRRGAGRRSHEYRTGRFPARENEVPGRLVEPTGWPVLSRLSTLVGTNFTWVRSPDCSRSGVLYTVGHTGWEPVGRQVQREARRRCQRGSFGRVRSFPTTAVG
jgi:collagen type I alpha